MDSRGSSGFIRTSPEEQGIASSVILDFIHALEQSNQEVHSFMLVRHNAVVAEGWWTPYGPTIPHMMFSLSKSFTSTAVGMAVGEGYFSIDDPVLSFFPDATPDQVTEHLATMQIKHLLTMSTGHDEKPFPFMYGRSDGNWSKSFFETPVIHPPGTHFLYNTGATYMLSELIQRVTGQKLLDFLTPRLFEPLGIQNPVWMEAPNGVSLGGIGLNLVTEDIARFGQLYLQKGVWKGQRLLDEAWIDEATSAQISNGNDPESDWAQGYGYQFWRCKHGIYRGDGAFGQFCFVMDDYDAVLAMTGAANDMQETMNIIWDVLLPGMQSERTTVNHDARNSVAEKISSLGFAPITGQATSTLVESVSGKTYLAEPNALDIRSFVFDFTHSDCTLRIKTQKGDESFIAPYGQWQKGSASLFNEIWLDGKHPFFASGAWETDQCYTIVVRLYETPYIYTFKNYFNGNSLTCIAQINVSLESNDALVIQATRKS